MNELTTLLKRKIRNYQKEIFGNIKKFQMSREDYWNRSFNKELIIVLKKSDSKSYENIGFPFPLLSKESKLKIPKGVSVMFFLTGEPILKFQREQLIKSLQKLKPTELIEINELEMFRDISKKVFEKYREFDYYDPYSFIGDSFIGLHFPETINLNFKTRLNRVYSENYEPLSSCVNSKGYIGNFSQKSTLNVFVDLMANQWNRTKYLVKVKSKNCEPSIIIGRDLIIIPNKKTIQVFYFKREGILLRDENIEDYMNQCLLPFVSEIKPVFKRKGKIKSDNLIINPFGSSEIKTLPINLTCKIINEYLSKNRHAKIIVISGFKHNYSHLLWAAQLREFIMNCKLEDKVILKDYGSFAEINKDIKKYQISIGITADTSIAHFFNHLNLLNFTFFNLDRVDLSSSQSLASDSPLGFCRYQFSQIPVLFSKKINNKIVKSILNGMAYFRGNQKETSWTKRLFNDKILISKISSKNKKLILANKKISPSYKIK